MNPTVYWILTAIALVVAELLTGTFFLLVLGVAAFAGAALSWLGMPLAVQAVAATLIGVLGVVLVQRYRARAPKAGTSGNAIDIGQRVTLQSWINESEGLARVSYRGALWDARIVGAREAGGMYYIRGIDGSTLHVAAERA